MNIVDGVVNHPIATICGMACSKVDTGRPNPRCPNSEQQSYLNSNNATCTFPTYTWPSCTLQPGLASLFVKQFSMASLLVKQFGVASLFEKKPICNQTGRASAAAQLNGTEVLGSRSRLGPPRRPRGPYYTGAVCLDRLTHLRILHMYMSYAYPCMVILSIISTCTCSRIIDTCLCTEHVGFGLDGVLVCCKGKCRVYIPY